MTLRRLRPHQVLVFAFGALPVLSAMAQYKVVRPDGSVTYTDRPPAESNVRVTAVGRTASQQAAAGDQALPVELRQAVARYPVTLYTSADCPPCDSGRKLLLQRGVPYSEKRIATEEDAQALERAVGARTVPALNVGAQPVRGFSEGDWTAFLDAAGYPRESRLPKNWPVAVPTPLVERSPPPIARAAAQPAPAADNEPTSPSTIRF